MDVFERILAEIEAARRVAIHRHRRPDGDAVGSQTGLKYLLLENYPDKEVRAVGDDPGRYTFIEGSAPDDVADGFYGDALAIVLDTAAEALVSDGRYAAAARTARLDHHVPEGPLCQTELVDPSFESCCGLVAAMAREAGWRVPPIAAKALFTGLVTDSGRFRHVGTTARTFELAAFLLREPFDLVGLYSSLYASDLDAVRMRASFALRIRLTPHGVAYLYTDRAELASLGADAYAISRGMVGVMADIRGVDIWANFTESEEGVLCELRSARREIRPVAARYGGGGHPTACGATVPDRETALRLLRDLDRLAGGPA